MNKTKTNSENEMPGAEMLMGDMNDGQMPATESEMPTGRMTDDTAENFSDQMNAEFSEMPMGDMMADTSDGFNGQMATMVGEMPQANMTSNGSNASFNSQNVSGEGEMPAGIMNEESSPYNAKQDKSKTIEIPGSWKLQLTYSS